MGRISTSIVALAPIALIAALSGCKRAPAGTVLGEWTYSTSEAAPTPLHPPKTVAAEVTWHSPKGEAVPLRFETELGEHVVGGVNWRVPKHIRVVLAQPSRAQLPAVNCMPAPPGVGVGPDGHSVAMPKGADGVPIGRASCFLIPRDAPASAAFNVDGDGAVTAGNLK